MAALGSLLLGVTPVAAADASVRVEEYGPFPTPVSGACEVEIDQRGDVWVEQYLASEVAKLDTASGHITEYPMPVAFAVPGGEEMGWDGGLWITEESANRIVRINTDDGNMHQFPIPWNAVFPDHRRPVNYGLALSDDITKGADGAMWFTSYGANAIGRIGLTTKKMTKYDIPTPVLNVPTAPTGIIKTGPGDTVIFNEPGANKIGAINVVTKKITEYAIPTPLTVPIGLNVGPDAAIWFSESAAQKLGRIDPTTGQVTEYGLLDMRRLLGESVRGNPVPFPGPLVTGSDGSIYFAENFGGLTGLGDKIGRFNPRTYEYAEFPTPTPYASPCDLNNEQAGSIWFGEIGPTANKVGRLTYQPAPNHRPK